MEDTENTEINFEEFDPARLVCEEPESKKPQVKPGEKENKGSEYIVIKLNYLYPSGAGEVKRAFKVNACEMSSETGVIMKEGSYGNEYSILSRVNINTDEGKGFYDFTREVDRTVCQFYKENFKVCGVGKDFDPEKPGKATTRILYQKDDEVGYLPSTYLKFFWYPKNNYKTKIFIPSAEEGEDPVELPWESAQNCKMRFIPCIHYYRCNNAGKGGFKVQNLCVSIVVLDIVPNANVITQKKILQMVDKTMAQRIQAQVAVIDKQRQQHSLPAINEISEEEEEEETFSGLSNIKKPSSKKNETFEEENQEDELEAQEDEGEAKTTPTIVKIPSLNKKNTSSVKTMMGGVKARN